jgi:hypothetical protein
MTARLALVAALAAACGGGSGARPEPGGARPEPQAPPGSAAAQPAPAAAAPAPPDVDAPPTPAKGYDAAACKVRVGTFEQRLRAVYERGEAESQLRERPVAAPDPGLTAPPVTVYLHGAADPMAAQFCGAWAVTVGVGESYVEINGRDRIAKAVAAVKARLPRGGRIEIQVGAHDGIGGTAPLFAALGKLGTLQLAVVVQRPAGDELPTPDAPVWAARRYRAMKRMDSGEQDKLRESLQLAGGPCIQITDVFKRALDSDGVLGRLVEVLPEAVAKCGCKDVDVDAFELFSVAIFNNGRYMLESGWLELAIRPASATTVTASTPLEFATGLAAIPREQRATGIKIEIPHDAGGATAPHLVERCKSER